MAQTTGRAWSRVQSSPGSWTPCRNVLRWLLRNRVCARRSGREGGGGGGETLRLVEGVDDVQFEYADVDQFATTLLYSHLVLG